MARSSKKKAAPNKSRSRSRLKDRASETEQKAVQKARKSPFRGASETERKAAVPAREGRRAAPRGVSETERKVVQKPAKKSVKKSVKKPTRAERLEAEIKQLRAEQKKAERERQKEKAELKRSKADLTKTKAGLEKLKAQEERKKARKKKRKERAPAETAERKYKSKVGKTTHISATEIEGEPQYVWKELEDKSADKLVRTKKGKPKRWARLVVELSKESLLFPENYRRLRGKAVIRTNWHPAHELVGKASEVMDKLQQSGAVVPRAKIVIVESEKKPPRRVF